VPSILVAVVIVVVVLGLFLLVARRSPGDAERSSSWPTRGGDGGLGL
jgi:Tfp pilus assembly protein PilX